jgi:hypothetical protein
MADNPKKTAADHKRIDVSQEHECRYWSETFGVSPDALKAAVYEVGPMPQDVRDFLARSQRKAQDVRE